MKSRISSGLFPALNSSSSFSGAPVAGAAGPPPFRNAIRPGDAPAATSISSSAAVSGSTPPARLTSARMSSSG